MLSRKIYIVRRMITMSGEAPISVFFNGFYALIFLILIFCFSTLLSHPAKLPNSYVNAYPWAYLYHVRKMFLL